MNRITQNLLAVENNIRRLCNCDRIGCIRYTVTWKCNSRCESCDIWNKAIGDDDLKAAELDKLCKSPLLKHVRRIILSGGEPTLREDFPELVSVLYKNLPNAYFGITLNGLLPDRTAKMVETIVKENPGIHIRNVGISLNGPEEIHDKSRGVPGSFEKAIKTYHLIKDLVPTRFSFTFLPYNVDYFRWVRDYAKEIGSEAYLCWTVMNDRFDVQQKDLNFFKEGVKDHLREYLKEHNFTTRLCMAYLYDHFIKEQFMQCYAARQFFHLAPNGDIYPCNFKLSDDRIYGNIRQKSLEEIWRNPERQRILKEIDCGECLYPNGPCGDSDLTYSNRNNPFALVGWYLKKRLLLKKLID